MKNKPKSPQRIIETKPFIKKYNWEGIHYSSEKDDWKKFEKFNLTVALNFSILRQEKTTETNYSFNNSKRKKME